MKILCGEKLPESFYLQPDVVQIARNLLGKILCTHIDGSFTSGIICETEAYAGVSDKASHAYGGRRTNRTEIMYAKGGKAYVYLCYGMHALFNVVTNQENIPHAVLIRGIIPLEGKDIMLKRLNKEKLNSNDGIGPGKITKLLGIQVLHSGLSLLENTIWIANSSLEFSRDKITTTSRVGVHYAGEDAKLPYRFLVENFFTL